ncbi:MAG: 4-hydroxy-3-methylbut-2-en-1-yl diphosphate synthase [Dehalococcoidia bacterium]|nr:4-hydroxy-3-methylbut-2-en-1-yl diphosphate synthase [Dehalococcoidia bacterium]
MIAAEASPHLAGVGRYTYQRRRTRCVMVGDVGVGGDHPIRVQSMTTPATQDVAATVAQTIRLTEAGCEIVRITVPTVADAHALRAIRAELRGRGVRVPLVADIHFSPAAALEAARHVEKVRVNPGNFADSKRFAVREYTDQQYAEELERVAERFAPLVLRCKELGAAMRIGTNHGSLSDRVLNRYGDTPLGMVESALEFVHICEDHGYYDVIFSMKASNPKVMIQAYRLLAARLDERDTPYPFHLGVTEAGKGEDGRIKSAIGSGSLLDDGIGDTVRVSLTEEPEAEIPVAQALVQTYNEWQARRNEARRNGVSSPATVDEPAGAPVLPDTRDPYSYSRRASRATTLGDVAWGDRSPVRVVHRYAGPLATVPHVERRVRWARRADGWVQPRPDAVSVQVTSEADLAALRVLRQSTHGDLLGARIELPTLPLIVDAAPASPWLNEVVALADAVGLRIAPASLDREGRAPLAQACRLAAQHDTPVVLAPRGGQAPPRDDLAWSTALPTAATELGRTALAAVDVAEDASLADVVLSLGPADPALLVRAGRLLAARFAEAGRAYPLHFVTRISSDEHGLLLASSALGSLLSDGLGDSIEVVGPQGVDDGAAVQLAFNILQGAGVRLTKTEYVACPSCGRTLFDLQTTTDRIQRDTGHLRGVKIAIMGCIVNGPGEMADADFGYVGGAPGKVNLYVGKELVERHVPEVEASERLVSLIRRHGRWTEAPAPKPSDQ